MALVAHALTRHALAERCSRLPDGGEIVEADVRIRRVDNLFEVGRLGEAPAMCPLGVVAELARRARARAPVAVQAAVCPVCQRPGRVA